MTVRAYGESLFNTQVLKLLIGKLVTLLLKYFKLLSLFNDESRFCLKQSSTGNNPIKIWSKYTRYFCKLYHFRAMQKQSNCNTVWLSKMSELIWSKKFLQDVDPAACTIRQKMDRFCSTIVSFLLSLNYNSLDKHSSLQRIGTIRLEYVFMVLPPRCNCCKTKDLSNITQYHLVLSGIWQVSFSIIMLVSLSINVVQYICRLVVLSGIMKTQKGILMIWFLMVISQYFTVLLSNIGYCLGLYWKGFA